MFARVNLWTARRTLLQARLVLVPGSITRGNDWAAIDRTIPNQASTKTETLFGPASAAMEKKYFISMVPTSSSG